MEKELELLEELLAERVTLLKIGKGRLSEDCLKKTAEEREILIRIRETVMAADRNRKGSSQLTHDETVCVRRIIKELCPDFKL